VRRSGVRLSSGACGSDVRLPGSAAVSGKQCGSVQQCARLCCAEAHVAVCDSARGSVRGRLKPSGSLPAGVCGGAAAVQEAVSAAVCAAVCGSARGCVRQCADVCGSACGIVQQ
jgi:hypothetical protein